MSNTKPGQKTKPLSDQDDKLSGMIIFCPGCKNGHFFHTVPWIAGGGKAGPVWKFDGDVMKPTFSPSMLVNRDDPKSRCHSHVRSGRIQFLDDCYHGMKNMTVDLPDISEW